ncbi:MAG: chromosome partitioning protein ParB, partial [Chloroflexota bacterium]|nr:chromosome partitioning protein ParB [Chloroflexota bacterium]
RVLREEGWSQVPCVVVDIDDSRARLLSQALNRVQGTDDLGIKAEMLRHVMKNLPASEVVAVLPETTQSLESLCSLGQEDIASYLKNWQQAQTARLSHVQFQLTPDQLEVVEEAITSMLPRAREELSDSPNVRGMALYMLCKSYIDERSKV